LYRWLRPIPRDEALKRLGISKATFYRICGQAVEQIYLSINKGAALEIAKAKGTKSLLEAIFHT